VSDRTTLFRLEEERVNFGRPNVLGGVLLRLPPHASAGGEFHFAAFPGRRRESHLAAAKEVDDVVRMRVYRRARSFSKTTLYTCGATFAASSAIVSLLVGQILVRC
jgi:hypothetical protein